MGTRLKRWRWIFSAFVVFFEESIRRFFCLHWWPIVCPILFGRSRYTKLTRARKSISNIRRPLILATPGYLFLNFHNLFHPIRLQSRNSLFKSTRHIHLSNRFLRLSILGLPQTFPLSLLWGFLKSYLTVMLFWRLELYPNILFKILVQMKLLILSLVLFGLFQFCLILLV